MDFSIIIPLYNSERSLPILINEIENYFLGKFSYEIILVDDASDNKTSGLAASYASNDPKIKLISHKKNMGQQEAIFSGFKLASGDYAITIDDDLQHPIALFMDAVIERFGQEGRYPIMPNLYLCYGIGEESGLGVRNLGSQLISGYFRFKYKWLKGKRVSSLRVVSRELYHRVSCLRRQQGSFIYISAEILDVIESLGAEPEQKVHNFRIQKRPRIYGKSGYSFLKCLNIAIKLFARKTRVSRPKYMIVGAGACQLNAISRLGDRGFDVVAADYNEDSPGKKIAHIPVLADAFSVDDIKAAAEKYSVNAIMTTGTDQPVYTVNVVAKSLGLAHDLSEETAYAVTNKKEMKSRLVKAGIPTAEYLIMDANNLTGDDSLDKKLKRLEKLGGPFVTKPLDLQGQRGVFLLNTAEEVLMNASKVVEKSRTQEFIVEKYYENNEVTLSGWLDNGELRVLTIADRLCFEPSSALGVCCGHNFPSKVTDSQTEIELSALAQKVADEFKVKNGPLYIQYLLGAQGIIVNEIACRIGGAYEDLTIPTVTGFDILGAQIERGLDPKSRIKNEHFFKKPIFSYFAVELFFCEPGKVSRLQAPDDFLNKPWFGGYGFNIREGETIYKMCDATARAGYFIVYADSQETLDQRVKKIYNQLAVYSIDGRNLVIQS